MREKRGLTLGGGGSKGGYQIGAWKALRELDYEFDIVTGTSIGALNGALIVQGDFERVVTLWEKAETRDVLGYDSAENYTYLTGLINSYKNFTVELLKNRGFDFEPLLNIIADYFNVEKFRKSKIDYALMTVKFFTLEATPMYKKDIPPGKEADYLCASAACFPAMKLKEIDGVMYVDGGYRDNLPVGLAVEAGATEIIAVDLAYPYINRKFNFPGVKIKHIHSKWDLGNFIIVDQDVSKRNLNLGYLDTMKAFGKLEGVYYSFEKDNYLDSLNEIDYRMRSFLEKGYISTDGKNSDLTFKIAVESATKRLELEWEKNVEDERFYLALAEILGKIYQLSPERTYTIDEFNKMLVENYKGTVLPYESNSNYKDEIKNLIRRGVAEVKKSGIKAPLSNKISEYKKRIEDFDVKEALGKISTNISDWQIINIKHRMNIQNMVSLIEEAEHDNLAEEFSVVGVFNSYDFFLGLYMKLLLEQYEEVETVDKYEIKQHD